MPYYYSKYRTPRRIQKRRASMPMKKLQRSLLSLIRNPFISVADGRIPDGKAHLSLPVKVQQVGEQSVEAGNILEFLLFPGLNNALAINSFVTNGFYGAPVGAHAPANGSGQQSNTSGQIIQWRTVSAALRLSLVNNAVTNEGWFECARISLPKESDGWQFTQSGPGGNNTSSHYVLPNSENIFVPTERAVLRNHPTYATGKLRDIDRVMFKLRSTADVHEFNTLKDGTSDNDSWRYVDEGFDAIWIRVHGLAGTTRLLYNYVLNQEVVYDEASELARAMTRFPTYPMIDRMIRRYRNRQTPSSMETDSAIVSPDRKRPRITG
jgi:hypothetical protein